jgi:hypothetical protein
MRPHFFAGDTWIGDGGVFRVPQARYVVQRDDIADWRQRHDKHKQAHAMKYSNTSTQIHTSAPPQRSSAAAARREAAAILALIKAQQVHNQQLQAKLRRGASKLYFLEHVFTLKHE